MSNSDTKTDAFIEFLKKQLKKLENVRLENNYKSIPGGIIELDTYKYRPNNETFHIYIVVDKTTGCIVAVAFGKEEDNKGYLQ